MWARFLRRLVAASAVAALLLTGFAVAGAMAAGAPCDASMAMASGEPCDNSQDGDPAGGKHRAATMMCFAKCLGPVLGMPASATASGTRAALVRVAFVPVLAPGLVVAPPFHPPRS